MLAKADIIILGLHAANLGLTSPHGRPSLFVTDLIRDG